MMKHYMLHNEPVALVYHTEELLQDIAARCFVSAEAVENTGNNAAEMQKLGMAANDRVATKDALEDENRTLILRTIERTIWEANNLLYPFVATPVQTRTLENKPLEVEAYVMVLDGRKLGNRAESQVQMLKSAMHDYIVLKTTADWQQQTMPDNNIWQQTEARAQEAREQITQALVLPMRQVRIRPRY